MLIRTLLWGFQQIVIKEIDKLDPNSADRKKVIFEIYLAERSSINIRQLQKYLQKETTRFVQRLLKNRKWPLERFSSDIRNPFVLPVNENPYLVISDALNHMVRAVHQKRFRLQADRPSAKLKLLPHIILKPYQILDKALMKIQKSLKDPRPKHRGGQVLADVGEKDAIEKFLESLRSNSLDLAFKKNAVKRLWLDVNSRQKWHRLSDLDQLIETTDDTIRKERNYELGAVLTDSLHALIDEEERTEEFPKEILGERTLKVSDLHLTVINHLGGFLADDQRIRKALELCEALKYKMSCWPHIASFNAHLAVNYQNIFDFEKSLEILKPRIAFLETERVNPFTLQGMRAREMGTMLGTYSQTLAFDTHCRFFSDGVEALSGLEDAVLYSHLADDYFFEQADHVQQVTYRSHYQIQRYILSGDEKALSQAEQELQSDSYFEQALSSFLDNYPEGKSIVPAYRVVAHLKLSYFMKKTPDWLKDLNRALVNNAGTASIGHPLEQMLAYAALLEKNKTTRNQLKVILKRTSFPPNIVETIRRVMRVQLKHESGQKIIATDVEAVLDSVPATIKPHWQKYALDRVLTEHVHSHSIRRWTIGPMEVLPFNYC
jgi:hypothetical protein